MRGRDLDAKCMTSATNFRERERDQTPLTRSFRAPKHVFWNATRADLAHVVNRASWALVVILLATFGDFTGVRTVSETMTRRWRHCSWDWVATTGTPAGLWGRRLSVLYRLRVGHVCEFMPLRLWLETCQATCWHILLDCWSQQTEPPGCLEFAEWAGWSDGQVGRLHVRFWRREWNGGGGP